MLGRAQQSGLIRADAHQLREWATGRHNKTDELPYGGGPDMVMKPEPIFAAVEALRRPDTQVLYLAPDGEPPRLNSRKSWRTSHLILLSGHYEGSTSACVMRSLIGRSVLEIMY